ALAMDSVVHAAALSGNAPTTPAGCIADPDSSYCTITFADPAHDRITISPNGTGDTFASTGITIRVGIRNFAGQPLIGEPAQEFVLYNSALCICPGGSIADHPSDINGETTFTGTIMGSGCVNFLTLFFCGVPLCTLPIKTNSWDALPASPCFVDAGDVAAFATRLGSHTGDANYTICSDFNEHSMIDAGPLSSLATQLRPAR